MSAAEAIRRCPHAVFVRPRHSLYREYSRHVWSTVRGIVPTVEQTGLDEGYLDVGEVAARLPRGARRRRGGADRGARRDEPHVLARRRAVQGRREGRERRAQARRPASSSCRGRRRRSSRRSTSAGFPASGRRRRSGCAPRGVDDGRRARGARPTTTCAGCCPGSVGTVLRDRANGIDPRGLELDAERISISVENTFERDLVERERLHDELRGDGDARSPSTCRRAARSRAR